MSPNSASCLFRRSQYFLDSTRALLVNWRDRVTDPPAMQFFAALCDGGCDSNAHIDVLPKQRLMYVSVPKCASTTIKVALSALNGRKNATADKVHKRRHSGLQSPTHVGVSAFHRLATSPLTLRFAFVRNPYARLVSAWADKFQDKPLVPGNSFVDKYLGYRNAADLTSPCGADHTLSFAQFVAFATATALCRVDAHWQTQEDMLNMPGIMLDHVGKVETFDDDFLTVLDHIGRGPDVLHSAAPYLNTSSHRPWRDYYSQSLADDVYRAYERDFDMFGYTRASATGAD